MSIALISLVTPTPTNYRGASALPFHLIDEFVDNVYIYSFNINNVSKDEISYVEKALGTNIIIIGKSSKTERAYNLHTRLRVINPFPPLHYLSLPTKSCEEINKKYDCVWIYGEDIAHLSRLFPDKKVVVTTPDCEALYYKRLLDMKQPLLKRLRYMIAYDKYKRLVKHFDTHAIYHLVGESDRDYLLRLHPDLDAHFIRHPHYEMRSRNRQLFSDKKIKLLIAGRNDIYMGAPTSEAIEAICNSPELADHYDVTFLGKGWDPLEERLRAVGYDTQIKTWVEDYIGEISKHDIQLTPICVGTGTKGKVLDAFANGLLVIGTERALENIAVVNGVSCIQYNRHKELIDVLADIPYNRSKYLFMAEKGYEAILNNHSKRNVANKFCSLFNM